METSAVVTEGIIERFGGIRPMAGKLDMPVTTVQGWKKRGIIPQSRHADILSVAVREAIAVTAAELAEADPGTARSPEARTADGGSESPRVQTSVPVVSPAPPPVGRSWTGAAALGISLAVLVAVFGGGVAGWLYYLEPLRARIAALESRTSGLDSLEQRISKLEGGAIQPATRAGGPGDQTAAATGGTDRDRLAAVEQQIAELKASVANTGQLAKTLSDLGVAAGGRELLAQSIRDIQSSSAATQGEVERLNTQVTGFGQRLDQVDSVLSEHRRQTLKAEAVVLAVGQLRAALRGSRPFSKDLTAVRALVDSGDTEMLALLDQIQPYSDDGVPTIGDLNQDFDRLAPDIVRSAVVGDGQSWWRQALYHLESAISIRRVGPNAPGDGADAIVARAEARLQEEDLPGAVTALRTLSGNPAEMASPWIHDAVKRIAVDSAESDMTRLAIEHVGSGAAPTQAAPGSRQTAPATQ